MRSRHFPITFEEFELLHREPGWKYEYWEGHAHITPRHQVATVGLRVERRVARLPAQLELREVQATDDAELRRLFVAAFEHTIHYCDATSEHVAEAARENIEGFLSGRRGAPHHASRVGFRSARARGESAIVGAALVLAHGEHRAALDLLMVHPDWQRRGVATALASAVLDQLDRDGIDVLESRYDLGNAASRGWHARFGFVEEPDLLLARSRLADAMHERWRRERAGDLSDRSGRCSKPRSAAGEQTLTPLRHRQRPREWRRSCRCCGGRELKPFERPLHLMQFEHNAARAEFQQRRSMPPRSPDRCNGW